MTTKPKPPGQWAEQQRVAERKDKKKQSAKQPQMQQSSAVEQQDRIDAGDNDAPAESETR